MLNYRAQKKSVCRWAIELVQCDKLDRTYLPPSNSVSAGGNLEDLHVPLEYAKENYPLAVETGKDENIIEEYYPIAAFGTDEELPSVSALTESSLPADSYVDLMPGTLFPQEYSSTSSSLIPRLSYEQYLIQQIIGPNAPQQGTVDSGASSENFKNENFGLDSVNQLIGMSLESNNPTLQGKNLQQSQQNLPVESNSRKHILEKMHKISAPEQRVNIPSTKNEKQNEGDLDSILDVLISPKNVKQPNKTKTVHMKYLKAYNNNYLFSTISPVQLFEEISTSNMATPKPSLYPTYTLPTNNLRIQAENDRNSVVVDYTNTITPDGYAYSFDTTNGIHADESGTAVNGAKAIGSYSFTGDDGKVYKVEYTADEKGFIPRGDHLPTAPPIPSAILKSIQQAEKNRKIGIIDDGSYDDAKYGHERYQGTKGRSPHHRFTNSRNNKPSNTASAQNSKTISHADSTVNNVKDLNEIPISQQEDLIANPPNQSKMEKANINIYPVSKDLNVTKELRNENENIDAIQTDSGKLSSMNKTFSKEKNNIADQMELFHEGYHYVQTQSILNDNERNTLQSQLSSITPQQFIIPKISFMSSQENDPNLQILRTNVMGPLTTNEKIDSFEDLQNQPNGQSDKRNKEKNIRTEGDRVLSTPKPTYYTCLCHVYYESRGTPTLKRNMRINPSSVGAKLLVNQSTTPLPSEILSRASLFTSKFDYPQTTPTTVHVTSTLRSSITSRRPETKQQEPVFLESVAGQDIHSQYFTMKPKNFNLKVNGRPEYLDAPENTFVTQENLYGDLKSRLEESMHSSTNAPFSTVKIFVEDFSGPKQLQRFDTKYGYYY